MLSEQMPACGRGPPGAPAAATRRVQGTAAQSWHTARRPSDSVTQADGTVKMHSQGRTIFNEVSEQAEQQEPQGKRAPSAPSSSSAAQEPHLTSPAAPSAGTGFSAAS